MGQRNRHILLEYLECDVKMDQLAKDFSISLSRVGQIISSELHMLRCSDVSTSGRKIEARQRLHSKIMDRAQQQYGPDIDTDWVNTPAGFYHTQRGLSSIQWEA